MKKIISVFLAIVVIFSISATSVFAASESRTATWSLKASVLNASSSQANDRKNYLNTSNKIVYDSKNNPTICVYPGQVVWVTVHLETGSKYYAGDLQTYLYYTNNIFKSTDQGQGCYIWDTNGDYSGICSRVGAPYSKMVEEAKKNHYPSTWTASQKASHEFYSIIMYPNPNVTTTVSANIDDDLVTVPIYVKSNAAIGATGSIYFPEEFVLSNDRPNEKIYLSNYEDGGDILSKNTPYSDDMAFDVSDAKLNFLVCNKNAKGVTISDSSIEMNYKDSASLSATVSGVSNAKVAWSSSDTDVVAVDDNGNITATGRGNATITATYGNYTASCDVTVNFSFGQWLIWILLLGFLWY